eukprot:5295712-Prymnesium_polylepis.3
MPLTRGSAAVGWTVLMGVLLGCGFETSQPPEGVSLDWEAILAPSVDRFVADAAAWLTPSCRRCSEELRTLPRVASVFCTMRDMMAALAADVEV